MRHLSGVTKIGPTRGGASFSTIQHRERKGFATFFTVSDAVVQRVAGQRIFTTDELFRIYQILPDARAAIDKITLRVANTPWLVTPAMKKTEPGYERAYNMAEDVTRFLSKPNMDEEWPTFSGKWTQDTLLYDAYAVERVRGASGRLQELVCWRGGDIQPLTDEHGRNYAYSQSVAVRGPVKFLPEDMDYGNLFANTTYPDGQPLLETLVEEFITMRAQAQHLRRSVDADEIPPGLLALMGIEYVAYKRFEQQMEARAGRDDKLKMVALEAPGSTVEWIPFHRSMKDMEWLPNIKEVRHTIWRLFHVTPVTMGETENTPRASAEVQVEIADQGLIGPLLRRSERLANERWIPLILGNPELADMVVFAYDTTPDLSQADQKTRADRLKTLVESKIIDVNEARDELGYEAIHGGDGTKDPAESEDPAPPDQEPTAESGRHPGIVRRRPSAVTRSRGAITLRGDLPSDWQPEGRFKGKRTLPLKALADVVGAYDDAVTPLYLLCARNVLRAATDAVADGVFTTTEATSVVGAIGRETARLITDWSEATTPMYEDTARLGVDQAEAWGGASVAWKNIAATYQATSIGYLSASGARSQGLVTALRKELTDLVLATLSRPVPTRDRTTDQERADNQERADKLPAALGAFLEAVRRVFERHQHRIKNWSGKLVELANTTAIQSLKSATQPTAADPESTPDQWYVEWVEVADGSTCDVCREEGSKDIRPLSSLSTMPGGATECGSRCRCVLVFHLESEVKSGKAKRLGPVRSIRLPRR